MAQARWQAPCELRLSRAAAQWLTGGRCPNCPKSKPSAAASRPMSRARASRRSRSTARICATPFPRGFAKALEGQTIERIGRRGKVSPVPARRTARPGSRHLGMTGSFRFRGHHVRGAVALLRAGDRRKARPRRRSRSTHPKHGKLTHDLLPTPAASASWTCSTSDEASAVARAASAPSRWATSSTPSRWPPRFRARRRR